MSGANKFTRPRVPVEVTLTRLSRPDRTTQPYWRPVDLIESIR